MGEVCDKDCTDCDETQPLPTPSTRFHLPRCSPSPEEQSRLGKRFLSVLSALSVGTVGCLDQVEGAGQVNSPKVGKGRTSADTSS